MQALCGASMNTEHTLFHLKEALEQLQKTISSLESEELHQVELKLDLEHLYHHLNTAWNARNSTNEEARECSATNFKMWGQFPADLDLIE